MSSKLKEIGPFVPDSVVSSNGRWLATNRLAGATLFDIETLQEFCNLVNPGDTEPGSPSITFSPGCKLAIVGQVYPPGRTSPLAGWVPQRLDPFWSSPIGEPVVRLWEVESAQELLAFEECVKGAFSSDGKTLATLHFDNTIRLWNLPIRKPLGRILGQAFGVWLLFVAVIWVATVVVRRMKHLA